MLRYRDLLLVAPESRGAMNSLRKWLYRPRRDDKSLLAKFWWVQFFISFPFFAFLYCVCRSPTKVQCQKQTKTWVQHTLASLWQSKCWHKRPNIQTPYFANFRWRPNTLECCSMKKYCSFPPLFTLFVTAVQHFIKSPITSYTAGENTLKKTKSIPNSKENNWQIIIFEYIAKFRQIDLVKMQF